MTLRRTSVVWAASLAASAATLLSAPAARAAAAPEQEGSFQAGIGLGPLFSLSGGGGTAFNLTLQGSYAFRERLYGMFSPSFAFGAFGGAFITLPVGVQYDVAIESARGLFIYPRFSLGPGFYTGGGNAAFVLIPEAGIKYNVPEQFFLSFEPFSLPIAISSNTSVLYRITFGGGLYF